MKKGKNKKNTGKTIAKYLVIGILLVSMIGSVFAYLFAAIQSV